MTTFPKQLQNPCNVKFDCFIFVKVIPPEEVGEGTIKSPAAIVFDAETVSGVLPQRAIIAVAVFEVLLIEVIMVFVESNVILLETVDVPVILNVPLKFCVTAEDVDVVE